MTQTVPSAISDDTRSEPVRPYPPSWIDRLLRRIERWPTLVPLVLVGLWVVLVSIVHVTVWREGIVPRWQLDARILVINTWVPYGLGFIYYLERTAADALGAFRPALDLIDGAFADLRYQFTVMPQRGVLISSALGALLTLASLRLFPETADPFMDTPLAAAVNTVFSMAGAGVILTVIYLSFRQLRLIRRTYAQASKLDLFRASELYAFSSLTLRMGIGWLMVIYAGALFYPALMRNLPWAVTSGLILLSVAYTFVTTLFYIHVRIREAKARQMEEIDRRLQASFVALHRHIDANDTGAVRSLREVMEALLVERGMVVKLPTWPWQPGTLVSFLTAVLLPLIVWAVQAVLQRLLGL